MLQPDTETRQSDSSDTYVKPERWKNPENKIFPYQVGFTSPPHDFDAAPSDFKSIAPESVGVHGRLLHAPVYAHKLEQRVKNFNLLEEYVECMANAGADVCGQVGTNWSHAGGKSPEDIRQFLDRVSDKYETPLHMAGYCLIEAARELNVEKIAMNGVYFWPDWRDGIARFLREAGIDLVWVGNFVDQGFYETQEEVNARTWIFPGDLAIRSMEYVAEQAPTAEAFIVTGMCNWRNAEGLPKRVLSWTPQFEAAVGKPVIGSDTALHWRIFKTLGIAPAGENGALLGSLKSSTSS